MEARPHSGRLHFVLAALAAFLAGCSGPAQTPPPEHRSSVVEIGPLHPAPDGGTEGFARAPLDTHEIEWVTGFRAEPSAPSAAEHGWHADLRLANGTRLFAAAPGLPPIAFPEGFGLSLGQILRDTPEGWRSAELVASVAARAPTDERLRVTLDTTVPRPKEAEAEQPAMKRLYVLSLPLLNEASEADAASLPLPDWRLLTDPRAYWPIPAGGRQDRTGKYSYLVPTDVTVHYVAVWLEGPARSVRFTDLADGKVLWQADVQGKTIPSYSSANGFPLYREHEYEIAVTFDNSAATPVAGAAAVFVYYRPPGDEALGYPYPPPGEAAAP